MSEVAENEYDEQNSDFIIEDLEAPEPWNFREPIYDKDLPDPTEDEVLIKKKTRRVAKNVTSLKTPSNDLSSNKNDDGRSSPQPKMDSSLKSERKVSEYSPKLEVDSSNKKDTEKEAMFKVQDTVYNPRDNLQYAVSLGIDSSRVNMSAQDLRPSDDTEQENVNVNNQKETPDQDNQPESFQNDENVSALAPSPVHITQKETSVQEQVNFDKSIPSLKSPEVTMSIYSNNSLNSVQSVSTAQNILSQTVDKQDFNLDNVQVPANHEESSNNSTNNNDDLNIQTDNVANSITEHQIESNNAVAISPILSISKSECSIALHPTNEVTETVADYQATILEITQNSLIASETVEPVVDSENSLDKDDDNIIKESPTTAVNEDNKNGEELVENQSIKSSNSIKVSDSQAAPVIKKSDSDSTVSSENDAAVETEAATAAFDSENTDLELLSNKNIVQNDDSVVETPNVGENIEPQITESSSVEHPHSPVVSENHLVENDKAPIIASKTPSAVESESTVDSCSNISSSNIKDENEANFVIDDSDKMDKSHLQSADNEHVDELSVNHLISNTTTGISCDGEKDLQSMKNYNINENNQQPEIVQSPSPQQSDTAAIEEISDAENGNIDVSGTSINDEQPDLIADKSPTISAAVPENNENDNTIVGQTPINVSRSQPSVLKQSESVSEPEISVSKNDNINATELPVNDVTDSNASKLSVSAIPENNVTEEVDTSIDTSVTELHTNDVADSITSHSAENNVVKNDDTNVTEPATNDVADSIASHSSVPVVISEINITENDDSGVTKSPVNIATDLIAPQSPIAILENNIADTVVIEIPMNDVADSIAPQSPNSAISENNIAANEVTVATETTINDLADSIAPKSLNGTAESIASVVIESPLTIATDSIAPQPHTPAISENNIAANEDTVATEAPINDLADFIAPRSPTADSVATVVTETLVINVADSTAPPSPIPSISENNVAENDDSIVSEAPVNIAVATVVIETSINDVADSIAPQSLISSISENNITENDDIAATETPVNIAVATVVIETPINDVADSIAPQSPFSSISENNITEKDDIAVTETPVNIAVATVVIETSVNDVADSIAPQSPISSISENNITEHEDIAATETSVNDVADSIPPQITEKDDIAVTETPVNIAVATDVIETSVNNVADSIAPQSLIPSISENNVLENDDTVATETSVNDVADSIPPQSPIPSISDNNVAENDNIAATETPVNAAADSVATVVTETTINDVADLIAPQSPIPSISDNNVAENYNSVVDNSPDSHAVPDKEIIDSNQKQNSHVAIESDVDEPVTLAEESQDSTVVSKDSVNDSESIARSSCSRKNVESLVDSETSLVEDNSSVAEDTIAEKSSTCEVVNLEHQNIQSDSMNTTENGNKESEQPDSDFEHPPIESSESAAKTSEIESTDSPSCLEGPASKSDNSDVVVEGPSTGDSNSALIMSETKVSNGEKIDSNASDMSKAENEGGIVNSDESVDDNTTENVATPILEHLDSNIGPEQLADTADVASNENLESSVSAAKTSSAAVAPEVYVVGLETATVETVNIADESPIIEHQDPTAAESLINAKDNNIDIPVETNNVVNDSENYEVGNNSIITGTPIADQICSLIASQTNVIENDNCIAETSLVDDSNLTSSENAIISEKSIDAPCEQLDSGVVSDDSISPSIEHSDLAVVDSSKKDVDGQLSEKSDDKINDEIGNQSEVSIIEDSSEPTAVYKNLITDNDQVENPEEIESSKQSDSLPLAALIYINKVRSAKIELLLKQLSEAVKEMDNELVLLLQEREGKKKQ